jgi:magnesium-transporting ATPase (P-type)
MTTDLAPPRPRPAPGSAAAAQGLTGEEARRRLEQTGPNVLAAGEGPRWLRRFLRNFTHLFALLLWAGAGLALLGGQPPLAVAIVAVIVVNAIFSFAYVQATAMTYGGIVMGQVGAGFAFRTSRESVFSVGLLSNRFLLVGIALEIALLFALLYVPLLQEAFHMLPLDPLAWPLLALWPIFVVGAEEARKWALWRRRPREAAPTPHGRAT